MQLMKSFILLFSFDLGHADVVIDFVAKILATSANCSIQDH